MEKVSIIIPVYNGEHFLNKCVDSVLNQNYKNIEMILVDDGSTDRSGVICDEYEKEYPDIKVIHKKNGGQTSARKAGVQLASSEWVTFLDCDDWIEKDYIEKMINTIKISQDTDIVISERYIDSGTDVYVHRNGLAEGYYSKNQVMSKILPCFIWDKWTRKDLLIHSLCNILIHKSLADMALRDVDERLRLNEDGVALATAIKYARGIYVMSYAGYHYIMRDTSVTHNLSEREMEMLPVLYNAYIKVMNHCMDINQIKYQVNMRFGDMLINGVLKKWEMEYKTEFITPYEIVKKSSKVVIYGAGRFGKKYKDRLDKEAEFNVVAWVDKNYHNFPQEWNVESIDVLKDREYDMILIAISDPYIQKNVQKELIDKGIKFDKMWALRTENVLELIEA